MLVRVVWCNDFDGEWCLLIISPPSLKIPSLLFPSEFCWLSEELRLLFLKIVRSNETKTVRTKPKLEMKSENGETITTINSQSYSRNSDWIESISSADSVNSRVPSPQVLRAVLELTTKEQDSIFNYVIIHHRNRSHRGPYYSPFLPILQYFFISCRATFLQALQLLQT